MGGESSGEVEFVLLSLDDGLWVGVGSDHTDRKVEAYDVSVSKQMCAKPISRRFWRFDEVADHWDDLTLSSTIVSGGGREAYQEGTVAAMLRPEDLMARYGGAAGLAPGTCMFCGTLAVSGGVRPAERFEGRLHDPVLGRSLEVAYGAAALPHVE